MLIVVYAFTSSMSPLLPPPPTLPPLTIATTAVPTKGKEFRCSAHAETSARAARKAAAQNLIRIINIKYGVGVMDKVPYHRGLPPKFSPPPMTDMNSYEENEVQYACDKMQFIAQISHAICVRAIG
jgi:hypothetical protein